MSAMSDMLGDMLKKALPPEVMAMLTPENIKEIGDKANAFIVEVRGTLENIEDTQLLILKRMERLEENGGRNSSDRDGAGDATSNDGTSGD